MRRFLASLLVGSVALGRAASAQDADLHAATEALRNQLKELQQEIARQRADSTMLKIPPIPHLPSIPDLSQILPPPGSAFQARPGAQAGDQTDKFSRRLKLARTGSLSLSNIAGDIAVTVGSGDDVAIDAVKRSSDRSQLGDVDIQVTEFASRIDVKTEYARFSRSGGVSVDYTLVVPSYANLELHSVSGTIRVTGVQGPTRAETVSGDLLLADTPKLQLAKSVSGRIDLSGATAADDLTAETVSGDVRAKGVKAKSLTISTVSGRVTLNDVSTDRLAAKSVSGDLDYSGTLAKGGRYEMNTHSGGVRLVVNTGTGFEVDASSFSGAIRSDIPLTITGELRSRLAFGPRGGVTHATFGDGSAMLTLRTFSGDIVISK